MPIDRDNHTWEVWKDAHHEGRAVTDVCIRRASSPLAFKQTYFTLQLTQPHMHLMFARPKMTNKMHHYSYDVVCPTCRKHIIPPKFSRCTPKSPYVELPGYCPKIFSSIAGCVIQKKYSEALVRMDRGWSCEVVATLLGNH